MQGLSNFTYNVGIYCRLSRDDGQDSESSSIQTQKELLTEYVKERNWNIYNIYIDDGYTGTNFDRPGFKSLINDVESKKINLVITKDLSRLGRNYIHTGFYTEEYFPNHDVRYIAINDNVDTEGKENEFASFKNIINEWYAKDISKKVKSSIELKSRNGISPSGNALYGYQYDDSRKRIINPDTAPVVRYIFESYIKGKTTYDISKELEEMKIYSPMYYLFYKYGQQPKKYDGLIETDKYKWGASHIAKILRNIEYTGELRLLKTRMKSFKVHKKIKSNEEDMYIFKDKCEQIITLEQFQKANELMNLKKKSSISLDTNRYKETLVCSHCGETLKFTKKKTNNNKEYIVYMCKNKNCTNKTSIKVTEVDKIIYQELLTLKTILLKHKTEFLEFSHQYTKKDIEKPKTDTLKDSLLVNLLNKNDELDKLISTLIEAKAKDEIPSSTYQKLMKQYSEEKNEVEDKLIKLSENPKIKQIEQQEDYYQQSKKIIELFESIKDEELLSREIISSTIKSVIITTKQLSKNSHNIISQMNITYYAINQMLEGFINECSNIC